MQIVLCNLNNKHLHAACLLKLEEEKKIHLLPDKLFESIFVLIAIVPI